VKFTSLLANLVIFHTALDIADVARQLQAEGRPVDPLGLAQVESPGRSSGGAALADHGC
jgi:hypothetical protein